MKITMLLVASVCSYGSTQAQEIWDARTDRIYQLAVADAQDLERGAPHPISVQIAIDFLNLDEMQAYLCITFPDPQDRAFYRKTFLTYIAIQNKEP
jgi:hypothetical protein